MKERPILFSAPMVRALLAGTKTQTRRIVKPQPPYQPVLATHLARRGYPVWHCEQWQKFCPYGQPGDRLWVREAWAAFGPFKDGMHCHYRATDEHPEASKWKPSIHMPRWASRILLEIVAIRVERLQDISERDAEAEGCTADPADGPTFYDDFAHIWRQISGPDSWAANPFVWVLEFKRVTP